MSNNRRKADIRLLNTLKEMKEDIEMMEWALENSPDDMINVIDRYHGHLKHHMQQIRYHTSNIKSWKTKNSTTETT